MAMSLGEERQPKRFKRPLKCEFNGQKWVYTTK